MKLLDFIVENIIANSLMLINLASEIFLVYMLLRILSDQDKTYKEIRNGTKDLIDAGKKLHSMFSIAERLADRKLNENAPYPKSNDNNNNHFFEQRIVESIKKLELLMSETFSHINSMMTLPESDIPRWRDSNMQSVQKLIADQQLLKPEIAKIQDSLYRLSKDIRQTSNPTMIDSEDRDGDAQQQTIKSYQEMLIKTRERAKSAEQKISVLQSEVDLQSKRNDKILAENASETNQLKQEIKKINDERTSLIRNMDALTNEILRTKIEKDFIEDRFIELS